MCLFASNFRNCRIGRNTAVALMSVAVMDCSSGRCISANEVEDSLSWLTCLMACLYNVSPSILAASIAVPLA